MRVFPLPFEPVRSLRGTFPLSALPALTWWLAMQSGVALRRECVRWRAVVVVEASQANSRLSWNMGVRSRFLGGLSAWVLQPSASY